MSVSRREMKYPYALHLCYPVAEASPRLNCTELPLYHDARPRWRAADMDGYGLWHSSSWHMLEVQYAQGRASHPTGEPGGDSSETMWMPLS